MWCLALSVTLLSWYPLCAVATSWLHKQLVCCLESWFRSLQEALQLRFLHASPYLDSGNLKRLLKFSKILTVMKSIQGWVSQDLAASFSVNLRHVKCPTTVLAKLTLPGLWDFKSVISPTPICLFPFCLLKIKLCHFTYWGKWE